MAEALPALGAFVALLPSMQSVMGEDLLALDVPLPEIKALSPMGGCCYLLGNELQLKFFP